jgi:asparagine synthase (glutamine-hydrolysing)
LLSEFTRRHVKVALGGDGGDELFAGYPTLQAHRLAGYYTRVPRGLRRALVEPVVRRLPVSRGNLSFDFRAKRFIEGADLPVPDRHRAWMGSFRSVEVRSENDDATLDPLNQVLALDMRYYLEGDILVKLDRASMMASLEARVPLLNNEFVTYATSLPLNLKLRGLRSKFLFKRALRGVLPQHILDRPKKGFGIPVADWFRGPLREEMLTALAADRVAGDGFFDPGAVDRLVRDHLDGRADNRKQLWTLFAFQKWHEGYNSLGRG